MEKKETSYGKTESSSKTSCNFKNGKPFFCLLHREFVARALKMSDKSQASILSNLYLMCSNSSFVISPCWTRCQQ